MPEADYSYYVSADISEGDTGSGDYSCIEVIRIGTGQEADEQVAEWHGYMNPTPLGDVCTALGYMYNGAQIAVECNGVGISTNNQVWRRNEYDNIYRWKHIDRVKNFVTDAMGWWTNSKTRDIIITKMREAIMERTLVLRSLRLLDQMMDFSKEEGASRYEGQETPDDRVFGIMIGSYCAHESDYGKQAAAQNSKRRPEVEAWLLYDPQGRLMKETQDYDQAMAFICSKAGWSMRPKMDKYRVSWVVMDSNGKKIDEIDDFELARTMCLSNKYSMRQAVNRPDFQNTDHSIIHDKSGVHQKLYEQGVPPEMIHGEMLLHAQLAAGPPSDAEMADSWKNL